MEEDQLVTSELYSVLQPKEETHLLLPCDWRQGEWGGRGSTAKSSHKLPSHPWRWPWQGCMVEAPVVWVTQDGSAVLGWHKAPSPFLSPPAPWDRWSPEFLSPSGTSNLDNSFWVFCLMNKLFSAPELDYKFLEVTFLCFFCLSPSPSHPNPTPYSGRHIVGLQKKRLY